MSVDDERRAAFFRGFSFTFVLLIYQIKWPYSLSRPNGLLCTYVTYYPNREEVAGWGGGNAAMLMPKISRTDG